MNKTTEDIRRFYENQLLAHSNSLEAAKKSIRKTSISRIAIFLITILGIYLASTINWITVALVSAAGFGLFVFFVIRHARLFKQKQWYEALVKINKTELKVLDGDTSEKYQGTEWINPEHDYTSDLDIFGKKSLFQLIDRSATQHGRIALASTLASPIKNSGILKNRQAAIAELRDKATWRQQFEATGKLSDEGEESINELLNWVKATDTSFGSAFYKLMLVVVPVTGFSVIGLISFDYLGFGAFILFLLLPFFIYMTKMGAINKEHSELSQKAGLLEKYAGIMKLVEDENFESDILNKAKNNLTSSERSASHSIEKLSKILSSFDYRLNFLVGIFLNIFFLWDFKQCIKLENWKSQHRDDVNEWFETLARVDELCSFAGFAFNKPQSVFPETTEGRFELKATNAKHPYINQNKCVGNSISFDNWKQFQIITGANMAGKSTYLRTTGVNLVLAMTGSVVLADAFVFTPVDLFTGIKTSDSLQDGESYFFAELKRIETLIRLLNSGKKMFIILDEILRGTNSADKQKGSKSLIAQLINLNAVGMIATHDLALGELAKTFPGYVTNKRFEVEIENNELVFDYTLKEGISQNLNATFLMKKMGITVED